MRHLPAWLNPEVLGPIALSWGGRIVAAVLIFVVGRWVSMALTGWITRAVTKAGVDETLRRFFHNLIYMTFMVFVILTAVSALGVPTTKATRRIDLVIGIAYEDDVALAKSLIGEVPKADDRVLSDPAPTVMLLELGDSSVNIAVRPWVESSDYWAVRADVLERCKGTIEEHGLSIPFPQRDVHIVSQAEG